MHRLVLESDGVVTRHLACGARELTQIDSRGRVREKHLFPVEGSEAPWRRTFAYSAEGDLLAVKDSERGETRYQYDAAHQLAGVTRPDERGEKYTYDAVGNLVEAPHLPAAAIGPGNQLLMTNGSSLGYDHRNNVCEWERDGRSLRFRRDALDRLRAIEGLDAAWTADYDPLGRRIRKTFGASWTEYFWDTDRLAAELHSSGRVRVYVYVDDFSLTPWLMIDYDSVDAEPGRGKLHYLLTDQRGAPVAALDGSGQRVWSAELAPYGLAQVHGSLDVPHRLAGQLHDAETGLCYNRFRYYSPELGRYLEEDPAGTGGGLNLYAYTCCPLVQFDPRGLDTCDVCGSASDKEDGCDCKDATPNKSDDESGLLLSREEAIALAEAANAKYMAELNQKIHGDPQTMTQDDAGPVVATTVDRRTGYVSQTYHNPADGALPGKIPDVMKPGLEAAQAERPHRSEPGSHAEIYSTAEAINRREEETGRPVNPEEMGNL
ncbi:RHS repeat domain-containing protein [Nannocystis pusilla]|uniref:RHS repeat domain-containing protein n=1 Tax=Nannocystis pusilla TaxID=889268 RepID=UPI003B7D55C9